MGVSVITGGAGGMGMALAKFEVKNRKVLLVDVSQERLEEAKAKFAQDGYDVEIMTCDISDRDNVKALAEKALSMGKIDAVFHTAGISNGPVETVMKVDCLGTYYMIEEFFKVLEKGSSLLTVSSLATHFLKYTATPEMIDLLDHPEAPDFQEKFCKISEDMGADTHNGAGGMAYTLAKLFVWRYTRRNVMRFWSKEIRINTVTPGIISTPMALADKEGSMEVSKYMAIRRFGTPEEMASVMHYLGSELAGDITGVDYAVDGGLTCLQEFEQIQP